MISPEELNNVFPVDEEDITLAELEMIQVELDLRTSEDLQEVLTA